MTVAQNKKVAKLTRELELDDLSKALYFPRFFEVETVNACNARCRICTIAEWSRRKSYLMPGRIWNKFLNEIKNYSHWINRVNLSRDGEPLLDPRLETRIRDLKNAGIRYVTLSTNGSLLNKKIGRSLLDSGLDDIMFSIDGLTKETFERIRIGLKFEEVAGNCIDFIKMRDSMNYKTTIRVRMVLQDENRGELEGWLKYWKPFLKTKRGDRVYAKPAHSWGNQLKGYRDIVGQAADKDYSGELCISPWSTLVVKVNGDIPMCPVDFKCRYFMGNIGKSAIKDIWNSDGFNNVRDRLTSGQRNSLKLCKDCYLWDRETVLESHEDQ